ncbi:YccF domain-containing protein [Desulfovibrio aerotolerans]|uniref:YccF domain-containing protein n=1 Tax=Solidesulfovibrio aerotolerans TaxID=295255 RepID=A0A7C9N6E9_9BACT|nr:YccF domain-containing protein [Solidesulfovibrio aerotolerans]MYL84215.1 YccF domain-containing protein [Solidesulfovibrio aerotolerans]
MQPVNFLMNILWLILGGFWMAIGWYLAGVVMAITIIGLPWARACFVLGNLSLWPFGKEVVDRRDVSGHDIGTGTLGFIGNVIWFVLAGVWLAIGHLLAAVANFVTIIGIPFALQHLKLAGLALAPIGKTVIEKRY